MVWTVAPITDTTNTKQQSFQTTKLPASAILHDVVISLLLRCFMFVWCVIIEIDHLEIISINKHFSSFRAQWDIIFDRIYVRTCKSFNSWLCLHVQWPTSIRSHVLAAAFTSIWNVIGKSNEMFLLSYCMLLSVLLIFTFKCMHLANAFIQSDLHYLCLCHAPLSELRLCAWFMFVFVII